MRYVLFFMTLLMGVGTAASLSVDYLGVPEGGAIMNPKETTKSGEPIVADVTLKKIGDILPDESRLNLTLDMVNPWVRVEIDGAEQTFANKAEIEVTLPEEVKEIKIHVTGEAPDVEKLTKLSVVDVKTYVRYKGAEGEYQEEVLMYLDVTNPEIKSTLGAIEDAQDKLAVAEAKVATLKSSGVNTVELEAQLQNAKELLENAQTLHEREQIDLAKSTAESASKILDGVILDAEKSGVGPVPLDLRRYLVIGGAVIVVLIVALLIKGKREELG